MKLRGTRDPRSEVLKHMAWMELEYGVVCEWTYVACLAAGRPPFTRCCLTVSWEPGYGPQDVQHFICEAWPQGTEVKKMESARLLMLTKLQFDVHMFIHWGGEECLYLLPRD